MDAKSKLVLLIMACLSLGLAPFRPEPHIWGKLKWIAGGAKGMTMMDWADALMHGLPCLLLIGFLVQWVMNWVKEKREKKSRSNLDEI